MLSGGAYVKGHIISYFDMCRREGTSLQRGMNFRLRGRHSVILMSQRPNAPYADRVEEDGTVLIYEGHDVSKSLDAPVPKLLDQPEFSPSGRPTENGKFSAAAQQFKAGKKGPDIVRVYEKVRTGIWTEGVHPILPASMVRRLTTGTPYHRLSRRALGSTITS